MDIYEKIRDGVKSTREACTELDIALGEEPSTEEEELKNNERIEKLAAQVEAGMKLCKGLLSGRKTESGRPESDTYLRLRLHSMGLTIEAFTSVVQLHLSAETPLSNESKEYFFSEIDDLWKRMIKYHRPKVQN